MHRACHNESLISCKIFNPDGYLEIISVFSN